MSRSERAELLVEAVRRGGHQLEHGPVELLHLSPTARDGQPRGAGARLARVAPARLAAHAQVRVDDEVALEAQEEMLAVGVDRRHRAACEALRPAVAPEPRMRR